MTLTRPSPGSITSNFGKRVAPREGASTNHLGLDFGHDHGTRIIAAAAGRVISVGTAGGWGRRIVIDHGNNTTTLYAHLAAYRVKAGQHVTAGQEIAVMGTTGTSTGVHLHFEYRIKGVPTDPAPHLTGTTGSTTTTTTDTTGDETVFVAIRNGSFYLIAPTGAKPRAIPLGQNDLTEGMPKVRFATSAAWANLKATVANPADLVK